MILNSRKTYLAWASESATLYAPTTWSSLPLVCHGIEYDTSKKYASVLRVVPWSRDLHNKFFFETDTFYEDPFEYRKFSREFAIYRHHCRKPPVSREAIHESCGYMDPVTLIGQEIELVREAYALFVMRKEMESSGKIWVSEARAKILFTATMFDTMKTLIQEKVVVKVKADQYTFKWALDAARPFMGTQPPQHSAETHDFTAPIRPMLRRKQVNEMMLFANPDNIPPVPEFATMKVTLQDVHRMMEVDTCARRILVVSNTGTSSLRPKVKGVGSVVLVRALRDIGPEVKKGRVAFLQWRPGNVYKLMSNHGRELATLGERDAFDWTNVAMSATFDELMDIPAGAYDSIVVSGRRQPETSRWRYDCARIVRWDLNECIMIDP